MDATSEASYAEFVRSRWRDLIRAAIFLGASPHEAEDLAQQTLVRCYANWQRVNDATNRDAYVYRMLLNQLRDVRRIDATTEEDRQIKFAHRTFAWTSEATGKAAVHCVIIGFTRDKAVPRTLFTYPNIHAEPVAAKKSGPISRYLIFRPDVAVRSRRTPLSPELPKVSLGSIPYDWGYLTVEADEYSDVMADLVAAKYVRPFINGRELINHSPRWCLWMEDLDPSDIAKSPLLKGRITAVAEKRQNSNDLATRNLAATPHLMRPNPHRLAGPYLGMPRVFAESRLYGTAERFAGDVIAGGKVYTCPDPDGFVFAIISSMFITWQRTVGGRIKSDPSCSTDIVWNNLPLPAVSPEVRAQIIKAGEGVLKARALKPDRSLA